MDKKILLLGSTGKMGTALKVFLKGSCQIISKNSRDFDAMSLDQVKSLIEANKPEIVINTVAFLGIDPCEHEPEKAFRLNTLYPKLLSELSRDKGFLLVHFSTDAVFNDEKGDFYTESDSPCPLNLYGVTKYGADCFIQANAERHYIFRIPVLFGETPKNNQFVEKMLQRVKAGQGKLRISDDIISSPTYSKDVAREIKRIIDNELPYGLYHIANQGKASLYELMELISNTLQPGIELERASYMDFPFTGIKNTLTPIRSEKLPPLRHWRESVKEYCNALRGYSPNFTGNDTI